MKRRRVSVRKEYDGEGKLVSEVTETVEEEDTGGYPWNEYLPPGRVRPYVPGWPYVPEYPVERIRWGSPWGTGTPPVDYTPVVWCAAGAK